MSPASPRPHAWGSAASLVVLGVLVRPMPPEPLAIATVVESASRSSPLASSPRPPSVVDYGPCIAVGADALDPAPAPARCIFDPEQPLRLWLEPERIDEVEVLVDGRRAPTSPLEPVDDASRGLGVRLPENASWIEVRFGEHPERWSLPVRARGCAECHAGSDAANVVVKALHARMLDPADDGGWRDELPRALVVLDALGAREEQIGLLSAAMDVLAQQHRFDAAEQVGALGDPLAAGPPRHASILDYHRGVVDWRRGEHDDALVSLRAASLHAARSGELDVGLAALPMYAELLGEQGYFQASLHWSRVAIEQARAHAGSCELAATLRTTGWSHLLLRQQGWAHLDPVPMLEESLAIYGRGGACPRPGHTGGAYASLALLRLERGAPGEALGLVRRAAASPMLPAERVLAADVELEARLALGQPRADIDAALERLRRAVTDAGTIDAQWHLLLREGEVQASRGEHAAAIESYRAAEASVDELARLAALGLGRTATAASHRESNERLVDALRAQGRTSEALCVARQGAARRILAASLPPSLPAAERGRLERRVDAQRRAQAELEDLLAREQEAPVQELATIRDGAARQRRMLAAQTDALLRDVGRLGRPPSCEAFHRPAPGELLLGLFPHGERWLLFAQDETETTVHAVDLRELHLVTASARLAELLLRPVAAQLRRAQRIRVHAVGQAQRVDVERLPWEGEPLVARVPVAWGVDANASEPADATGDAERVAVLLADPTGSLPEAEREIRGASERLARLGWRVDEIARQDAHPHTVLERMATARLLHYAGHAEHDARSERGGWPPYPGGSPSWPARLRLAGGSQLAAHEIMVRHGQVPRMVILSGCRTGAIDDAAGGTSLAVAFLVAGAEEVLATREVTHDAEARSVVHEVYAELERQSGGPWSLVEALARVQARRIAAGEPDAGYRVWVR